MSSDAHLWMDDIFGWTTSLDGRQLSVNDETKPSFIRHNSGSGEIIFHFLSFVFPKLHSF